MNRLLLYFASGESLYPGVALLFLASLASGYRKSPWLVHARTGATWVGIAMIVMACPPFSWSVDVFLTITLSLWIFTCRRGYRATLWNGSQALTSLVLLVPMLAFSMAEYSHRKVPGLTGQIDDHLVLGDSLSAGIGDSAGSWPATMQKTTGIEVENLAKVGAGIADGLTMTAQVYPRDHLILIELGGNDLIAGESSGTFATGLEHLLAKLAAPGRTIVMFELPLIPPVVAYGQAQRRLAEKYGVVLIPKRFLIEVLSGRDATYDGLHLTNLGAARMAAMVAQILSPVLKRASSQSSCVRPDSRGGCSYMKTYSSRQMSLKS